jgi:hypothetical protein
MMTVFPVLLGGPGLVARQKGPMQAYRQEYFGLLPLTITIDAMSIQLAMHDVSFPVSFARQVL